MNGKSDKSLIVLNPAVLATASQKALTETQKLWSEGKLWMKYGGQVLENTKDNVVKATKSIKFSKPSKKAVAVLGGVLFTTAVIIKLFYEDSNIKTTYCSVYPDKYVMPTRLIIISDLHAKEYGELNSKLVEKIRKLNEESPETRNLILLDGDIIDSKSDGKEIVRISEFIRELASIAPVYYTFGNHELANKNLSLYRDELSTIDNLDILNGRNIKIDDDLSINGITHREAVKTTVLNRKFIMSNMQVEDERYNILLYHYPEKAIEYANRIKADLVIAGHVHGGQWRFFDQGIYCPSQGFLPKYTSGAHELSNKATLYITRGVGSGTSIPRINNNPEILVIDIQ